MSEATHRRTDDSAPGPYSVGELTDLVNELASIFTNEGEAEVLLRAAGFPLERAPRFTTPLVYWRLVITSTEHGVLNGATPIVEAAASLYPYNTIFKCRCRRDLDSDSGISRKIYKLTLETDHMTMEELGRLLEKIHHAVDDTSISLVGIEKGSIVLVLKMGERTADWLFDLVEREELSKQVGYRFPALLRSIRTFKRSF